MSSREFDTLRSRYPAEKSLLWELEAILARHLKKDPHAIIRDEIVAQELSGHLVGSLAEHRKRVGRFFLELVALDALQTIFLWKCDNGWGTAREALDLSSLPSVISCERCGEEHEFSQDKISVHFVPTKELRAHLIESP